MKSEQGNTVKSFDITLSRYRSDYSKNPSSTFYKGLVDNTESYIEELKEIKSYKRTHGIECWQVLFCIICAWLVGTFLILLYHLNFNAII